MRAGLAWAAISAMVAGPAMAADIVSERPEQVAVVLYQEHAPGRGSYDPGLAAVTETRTIDLPAGRSRIRFRDVADAIVPQTAALEGLPGRLVERDYDFDILSPGALLDTAVDQPATLVRTDPKTGAASRTAVVVRSGAEGVVLQAADGRAEALDCSGLPERLVFDHAPPGLTATPTLSVTVEPPSAGRYVVTLSYLATGLHWVADYVARVRPDERTLDLIGWLTLSNDGQTSFAHAPTQVVAGRLARVEGADEAPRPSAPFRARPPACWPEVAEAKTLIEPFGPAALALPSWPAPAPTVMVSAMRQAVVGDLGDYKLYTLPEPTTVAARQTKQVAFLSKARVPFDRIYAFTVQPVTQDRIEPARIILRMRNKATDGLGAPLPGGEMAIYEPTGDGRLFLTGEDRVKDTAIGLPLEIELGTAPDVTVSSRALKVDALPRNGVDRHRTELELTVRNAGAGAAAVELKQILPGYKISTESRPRQIKDAFAVWPILVPAGGKQTLRFTIEDRN